MRSHVRVFELDSRHDELDIYLLADMHLGSRAADERLVASTIAEIAANENAYWIGLGDVVDAVGRQDPRHREENLADWCRGRDGVFSLQRQRAVEALRPIGDRCLAYLMGNHEELLRATGIDLYYSVLEGIGGAPELALGMSGFLLLRFRRGNGGAVTITLFLHHGWGGGELAGGKALKLERLPAAYDADIYAIGHTHTKLMLSNVRSAVSSAGRVITRPIYMVNTGSFLRTSIAEAVTYSERRGLKPQALGPAILHLRPTASNPGDRVHVII